MFNSRNEAVLLAALIVITVGAIYLFAQLSKLSAPLLPASASAYAWEALANADNLQGGSSEIAVRESGSIINFDFLLTDDRSPPWVSFNLAFGDYENPTQYIDWSRYTTLNLVMTCTPSNLLLLTLYTFEEGLTQAGDFSTFRNPSRFFTCSEDRQTVKINLRDLATPEWWLDQHGVPLSDQKYRLDKVIGLALHNSYQSPRRVSSNVTIYAATLEGRDWRYFYLACLLGVALWSGVLVWAARRHTRRRIERIKEEIRKDQPFIPYQQLPTETRQDKNKDAVLNYLSTEYANPELNIEMVASAIGINRAKINEILKEERGLTFSVYLNKLRLAEAARLLLSKDSSVAEISYAVGYSNPSYFITVFKKEYGCTPKAFKTHREDSSNL